MWISWANKEENKQQTPNPYFTFKVRKTNTSVRVVFYRADLQHSAEKRMCGCLCCARLSVGGLHFVTVVLHRASYQQLTAKRCSTLLCQKGLQHLWFRRSYLSWLRVDRIRNVYVRWNDAIVGHFRPSKVWKSGVSGGPVQPPCEGHLNTPHTSPSHAPSS